VPTSNSLSPIPTTPIFLGKYNNGGALLPVDVILRVNQRNMPRERNGQSRVRRRRRNLTGIETYTI